MKKLPSHIWHLKGVDQRGPAVVILGGTHGDEQGGIELVRIFLRTLNLLKQPAGVYQRNDVKGNLFIGFGNPEAMLRNTRSASEGRNLNRSFGRQELFAPPSPEDRFDLLRARELVPLLAGADYLFDIHSTGSPSESFICFGEDNSKLRSIYSQLPVRFILTDPDEIYIRHEGAPEPCAIDDYVNRSGGIGLCYETGFARDPGSAPQILANLLPVLRALGSLNDVCLSLFDLPPREPLPARQQLFASRMPVMMEREGFVFAEGMIRGWQPLKKGQEIGRYGNGDAVRAPMDGMLVFPTYPDRLKVGKKICWIVERI